MARKKRIKFMSLDRGMEFVYVARRVVPHKTEKYVMANGMLASGWDHHSKLGIQT